VAIGGGRGFPMTERARRKWIDGHAAGLPVTRVARLLDRYGTIAADVIAAIVADDTDAPLVELPTYSTGELRYLAVTEDVVHLDDLLMRRSSLAFTGEATAAAAEVAEAVAPVLGWNDARVAHEIEHGLARVHAADPTWTGSEVTTR